jgi:hypothetical protein
MQSKKFLVWASHVSPEYTLRGNPVSVHSIDGVFWFADHPKLGCGKEYATPDSAIRGLLHSHGISRSISIMEVPSVH